MTRARSLRLLLHLFTGEPVDNRNAATEVHVTSRLPGSVAAIASPGTTCVAAAMACETASVPRASSPVSPVDGLRHEGDGVRCAIKIFGEFVRSASVTAPRWSHLPLNRMVATGPRPPGPIATTWKRYFLPFRTLALNTRLVVVFQALYFLPPGLEIRTR